MNFNFNNQRTKFHLTPPIMRHFSTIGLVTAKPEQTEGLLKPDCLFKNVQSNFFSVLPNKTFSNPNFVNKQNPNILIPSVAGAFKLSNCHENIKPNSHTQPKHDNYTKIPSEVVQPLPDKLSSQNTPEMPAPSEIINPKPAKKTRNRNRRSKKAKRQKEDFEQKSNMKNKIHCSSPKKFKKEPKSRKSKKSKPWHKISFEDEIMEFDEPEGPAKEGFCLQIKSAPIEISPKCSGIISEALSFSISPCTEFLKNLSTSNSSSDVISCSPSSPAIRRLRMPSECDSEDSFIIFCDDGNECLSEEISSDDDSEDDDDSDFDVVDFREKTDLNSGTKKKVTFANDDNLCTVHPMVQWGYAYHAARRGPWEQLARDRARFESRIFNTGNVLNSVLDPNHRDKVYHDRFQDE